MTGALRALTVTLDEATLARLDDLFPPVGNGGGLVTDRAVARPASNYGGKPRR